MIDDRCSFYAIAACAALTFVLTLAGMIQHFRHYRVPREQRQIVKILFTPVAFAVIALATTSNYHAAPYISSLAELYAAFALTAEFLLYIQFAVPGSDFGEDMFNGMLLAVEKARKKDNANWPKVTWITVFQYPVMETLSLLILIGSTAAGTYCAASMRPRFGHFWATIIRTVGK
jgi:hypothetical protein